MKKQTWQTIFFFGLTLTEFYIKKCLNSKSIYQCQKLSKFLNSWNNLFSKMLPYFWWCVWKSVKVISKKYLSFTDFFFKSKKLRHWGHATPGLLFCGYLSYQLWQKSTRGYAILAIILAPVMMAVFPFIMVITKVSQIDFKFKHQLSSLYQSRHTAF